MLRVENLVTYYGKALILKGVSIHIDSGEFVSIIGPNGAGKTTLLRTISGLVRPARGTITLNGEVIHDLPPYEIVRRGIVHCPERRRLAPHMTVLENLELGAYLRKNKKEVKEDLKNVFELFPILEERAHQKAGTLSGGEQQMLAIGRALMGRPKILLLDEPSLGLAPIVRNKIAESIRKIKKTGIAILMVEQDVQMALDLSNRGYVIESGKIWLEGDAKELLRTEHVRKYYLGV